MCTRNPFLVPVTTGEVQGGGGVAELADDGDGIGSRGMVMVDEFEEE